MPHRFPYRSFEPETIARAKRRDGFRVSVCVPVRDAEPTLGGIVAVVQRVLRDRMELVDEILVVDDHSVDGTAAVAEAAGAKVVRLADIDGRTDPAGPGVALSTAVAQAQGDVLCFVDPDSSNFWHQIVVGLIGPLVTCPRVDFVKGYYRTGEIEQRLSGDQMTELVARPLISRFLPDLATFIQPMSRDFAARRSCLEATPFVEGSGVELALLADLVRRIGIDKIAQVDLGTHFRRSRGLGELGPEALEILLAVLDRTQEDLATRGSVDLTRFNDEHQLERVRVHSGELDAVRESPAATATA